MNQQVNILGTFLRLMLHGFCIVVLSPMMVCSVYLWFDTEEGAMLFPPAALLGSFVIAIFGVFVTIPTALITLLIPITTGTVLRQSTPRQKFSIYLFFMAGFGCIVTGYFSWIVNHGQSPNPLLVLWGTAVGLFVGALLYYIWESDFPPENRYKEK